MLAETSFQVMCYLLSITHTTTQVQLANLPSPKSHWQPVCDRSTSTGRNFCS